MALSFNKYALIVQRLEKILAQKAFQKFSNGKVMAILARSPKTRIFKKKNQGGTKGNFSKIAQKLALAWKAQKHSGANCILL